MRDPTVGLRRTQPMLDFLMAQGGDLLSSANPIQELQHRDRVVEIIRLAIETLFETEAERLAAAHMLALLISSVWTSALSTAAAQLEKKGITEENTEDGAILFLNLFTQLMRTVAEVSNEQVKAYLDAHPD